MTFCQYSILLYVLYKTSTTGNIYFDTYQHTPKRLETSSMYIQHYIKHLLEYISDIYMYSVHDGYYTPSKPNKGFSKKKISSLKYS